MRLPRSLFAAAAMLTSLAGSAASETGPPVVESLELHGVTIAPESELHNLTVALGEQADASLKEIRVLTRGDRGKEPVDVKIGKYGTDRVYVDYGRSLGPEPADQIRLEARINENWSIGTDVSTDDSAGADLIWSLDY